MEIAEARAVAGRLRERVPHLDGSDLSEDALGVADRDATDPVDADAPESHRAD